MSILLSNSVFLHIPKTGGTWVTSVMREAGLIKKKLIYEDPYMSSEGVAPSNHTILKPEDSQPVVFSFVRHPLTWYRSYWAWKSRMFGWNPYNALDKKCGHPDFIQFIHRVITSYPEGYLGEMYPFFTNHCTHIGRYENLQADFLKFLEIAHEPFDRSLLDKIPPLLTSTEHSSTVKYPVSLAVQLMEAESNICETYNYNMLDNILL